MRGRINFRVLWPMSVVFFVVCLWAGCVWFCRRASSASFGLRPARSTLRQVLKAILPRYICPSLWASGPVIVVPLWWCIYAIFVDFWAGEGVRLHPHQQSIYLPTYLHTHTHTYISLHPTIRTTCKGRGTVWTATRARRRRRGRGGGGGGDVQGGDWLIVGVCVVGS